MIWHKVVVSMKTHFFKKVFRVSDLEISYFTRKNRLDMNCMNQV